MMEQIDPFWYFIFSIFIAIGLGIFFKFFVKPKIEIIYENNRQDLIRRMLNRIFQLDNGMSNIFQIMMRQPEFVANEERSYELSDRDLRLIRNWIPIIDTVFDEFADFNLRQHWRSHLRQGEFDSMLQYVHFSHNYVLQLMGDLHIHNDLNLEARRRFCFEMIHNFKHDLFDKWLPLDNNVHTLLHVFERT